MKLALQVLADCLAVSVLVVFSILWIGPPSAAELVVIVTEVWIYTILIATPAHWILPRMYPLVVDRPAAAQWTALIVQLAAISAAGSVIGSGVVFGLNLHPGATFGTIVAYSIERALFLALLVGVIHCMVILLRDRLDATEERLRAQTVENERALKLATEARLAALEARVHPHFLFNTLNTVTSLIPTAPARAERLLERLSALLRFSLDTHRGGMLPLREEMKIVRNYLEIEQARFGPRLRFRTEVTEQLGDIEIPALSVQTLVENSVKYAVDPSRDGADILIRASSEGDSLRIEVADTGPGFSSGSLPAGHGLDNLRNRLATLFGDAEALHVANRDGWTVVGFRLPA